MKARADWAAEEAAHTEAFDRIKQQLLRIPGVVDVGVGIKETGGGLTETVCFRVFVREKLPEDALPPEHVVPKTIDGFVTDVVKVRKWIDIIGFSEENDDKCYPIKVGGILIGNDKEKHGGTLGCFCRLTTDNSVVALSNHHVLFADGAAGGAKVGQPEYVTSCCCACNVIGAVLDGEPDPLDCAIAKLDADIKFYSKIKRIKRGDGTVEASGTLAGSENAVLNDEVWKVGARTGLTRGTIAQLSPNLEIHPKAPFTKIADHGDSGSVVVRFATDNVVGLLKQIDQEGGSLGLATPIAPVLARLKITVIATDPTQPNDVAESVEDRLERLSRIADDSAFARMADRLRRSPDGLAWLELIDAHREECRDLINRCRAVTVAWHRGKGPAYLAAVARSAKDPNYRIPRQIDGVSREHCTRLLFEALQRNGSPALAAALRAHGDELREAFACSDTADAMIGSVRPLSSPRVPEPVI
jgi:hypothetical protein